MNQELKEAKQVMRSFMRENYTDEKLAMLLAHARDGKFDYATCCCFIGIATADHALEPNSLSLNADWSHLDIAEGLPYGSEAEHATSRIGYIGSRRSDGLRERNERRARRVISMVKAEMRRRERARLAGVSSVTESEFCSLST